MYIVKIDHPLLSILNTVVAIIVIVLVSIFTYRYFTQPILCSAFSSHRKAQDAYEKSPHSMAYLDQDGDGVACEALK